MMLDSVPDEARDDRSFRVELAREATGIRRGRNMTTLLGNSNRACSARRSLDSMQVLAVAAEVADAEGLDSFRGFSRLESEDGHPLPHGLEGTFKYLLELLSAGIERLLHNSTEPRGCGQ